MIEPHYRFSGHETFACRYAWLPKIVDILDDDANAEILTTARENDAMVALGVGKNMVHSARYWAEAVGVIQVHGGYHKVTDLGRQLLIGDQDQCALDPYLEDIQTLWLIHWRLASNLSSLIFVWDFLLNRYQRPELHASAVVEELSNETECAKVSRGSLEQLWSVFLHSYIPTRGRKGEVREDNLDCPLVELDFLFPTGPTESFLNPGKTEQKYAFRREDKAEIGMGLFAFSMHEFWQNHHSTELTIPLHLLANGHGSPGQIFKIPEQDIRNRLFAIEEETGGFFRFEESSSIPRVVIDPECSSPSLDNIYKHQLSYV